ncbi:hypothetical protein Acsp02_89640 [Actinoplanes sp. NBRC 103695]|nr:hypothetical protein Acsp02_89640 [Actinoplanes sp. NBRC 103695]
MGKSLRGSRGVGRFGRAGGPEEQTAEVADQVVVAGDGPPSFTGHLDELPGRLAQEIGADEEVPASSHLPQAGVQGTGEHRQLVGKTAGIFPACGGVGSQLRPRPAQDLSQLAGGVAGEP